MNANSLDPNDLGPQNPKDPPFTARMRLHQSWYRAQVLKAPFGTGPKQTNKTPLGSMLARADGEKGLNYLLPHSLAVVKRRIAEHRGVLDEFRLLCNLMSAQAMVFNLFAPLVDQRDLATRLGQALFPGEVQQVERVLLAPASAHPQEYLNDGTAFDALLVYTRPDGKSAFAGFIGRLAEPPGQKGIANPAYRRWMEGPDAPWAAAPGPQWLEPEFNALWRGHLLAEALLRHPRSKYAGGRFVQLYHSGDPSAGQALERYRAGLKPDQDTFIALGIDALLARWEGETASDWMDKARLRYTDLSASQAAWEEYQNH